MGGWADGRMGGWADHEKTEPGSEEPGPSNRGGATIRLSAHPPRRLSRQIRQRSRLNRNQQTGTGQRLHAEDVDHRRISAGEEWSGSSRDNVEILGVIVDHVDRESHDIERARPG